MPIGRPFSQLVRTAALVVLAVMMLVRLGPLCETMAMAATPAASAMEDCATTPTNAPDKKNAPPACAMPCAAMPGDTIAHVEPMPFATLPPWAIAHPGLLGLTSAPATPPPQIV